MEDVVLETTAGGILRRIRKEFNISQPDISKNGVTTNLISLIERNEIPLKVDKAQVICKNINNVLQERSIDLIIEPEDLFNPRRYNAKEEVERYIAELDKNRDDKSYTIDLDDLDDLEFILNEYDLMDEKIKVYEIIGDIYFNNKDYEKEYEYMLKAWELTTRYPKRKLNYRIVVKLANNYIDRGKNEEAIALFEKALLKTEDIPEKYLIHIYYNYSLAFYRLERYPLSLEIISDLLNYTKRKDYDLWNKAYNLEGLCYFKMGEYEKSLNSYKKALQVLAFSGYSDDKYLLYGNIAEVYTKLNDEDRAYKYLDTIVENIDKLDNGLYSYSAICTQLAVTYENLRDYDLAEIYYKISLEYAKKNGYNNHIIKNLRSLIKLNDKKEIENISNIIEQCNDDVISNITINDNVLLMLKFMKVYVDNQEYDKFDKLIEDIKKYKGGRSR